MGPIIKPLTLAAVVLALVMTTGACTRRTPTTWQKSGAAQEDRNRDKINCRSLARRKVDREYRAETSEAGSGAYRASNTLSQTMNRYEAEKRQRALFEACLRSRGYSKNP